MIRPRIEFYLHHKDHRDPYSIPALALKLTFAGTQWGWLWTLSKDEYAAACVLWPKLSTSPTRQRITGL